MSKVILYKNDFGGVAVVVPTEDCLKYRTIEEIARKDVPHGKPYKIVDVADLPSDHTFFNAWEIDESILTDGVGSESTQFDPLVRSEE